MSYCGSCGRPLTGLGLRCAHCATLMPALWMNAASLGLLASIWWTHRLYARAVVPSLALSLGAIGAELPLPVRLHLAFMGPLVRWGVPALAVAVLALVALRSVFEMPFFLGSGAALLVVAAALALAHLLGLTAGLLAINAPVTRLS